MRHLHKADIKNYNKISDDNFRKNYRVEERFVIKDIVVWEHKFMSFIIDERNWKEAYPNTG